MPPLRGGVCTLTRAFRPQMGIQRMGRTTTEVVEQHLPDLDDAVLVVNLDADLVDHAQLQLPRTHRLVRLR